MHDFFDDFLVSTRKSFSLNYMMKKLFELSSLGDYQNENITKKEKEKLYLLNA